MEDKTNVMRILDRHKIVYRAYRYPADPVPSGVEVAAALSMPVQRVFKTLVTVGKSKQHYVFMIPVACELNLKKAALATDEKAIELIKARELLPLTGYVHGGCSPIGMKKTFPTFLDQTSQQCEQICFSAGKVGYQLEMEPALLERVLPVTIASLT